MRVVLLSGGSGKRLWPLSNEIRSKAFLKLLGTEEGGKESMIQRICGQLRSAGLLSSTCIVTHESQVEITRNHIGEQPPIISEPHKRGTFTAIALTAAYFHTILKAAPDEIIVVLPVDSYVEPSFFEAILHCPVALTRSHANLALIGTAPTSPSGQFGYIVPLSHSRSDYWPVAHFVEKPDEQTASDLISRNAMWNCGVFAFSLDFMLAFMVKKGLPLDYRELLSRYEQLPEKSFDQEVVEQTANRVVVPYTGFWKDLGSWDAFTHHLGSRIIGPGRITNNSSNTHLVNELTSPIHVIDVPNIIVAASADGILVASKNKSSLIKEQLIDMKDSPHQMPMYEEKRWGNRRVLDYSHCEDAGESLTSKISLFPGKSTSYHEHHRRKEICTVLSGVGEFMGNGKIEKIKVGSVLEIPPGLKHSIKAITALEYLEVQLGENLNVEDSTRLALAWEEVVSHTNSAAEQD